MLAYEELYAIDQANSQSAKLLMGHMRSSVGMSKRSLSGRPRINLIQRMTRFGLWLKNFPWPRHSSRGAGRTTRAFARN